MSTKHLLAISLFLPLLALSATAHAGSTITDKSYWPNEARQSAPNRAASQTGPVCCIRVRPSRNTFGASGRRRRIGRTLPRRPEGPLTRTSLANHDDEPAPWNSVPGADRVVAQCRCADQ